MSGPLQGIRIVELAQMIAVPAATNLLVEQGATSIKVENASRGDDLRAYGSRKNGMSGWFANANAGKRSIALALDQDEAKDILWALLADADVFIEGFRPGVVDRLGFGADAVRERFPRLISVSSSGFGDSGPYRDRPVYDPVIQALTGWAGMQTTESGPTLIRGMVADKIAALTTAQAVTAALVARGTTGEGQHIVMSMLDANIAFNWPDVMMDATLLDDDAMHLPNVLGAYQLFPAADGWVAVTAGNDNQWQSVCAALDRPDLASEERFATAANRGANFPDWYAAFGAMTAPFSAADIYERLVKADVPVAPVIHPTKVADDEQVLATGAIVERDHPVIGRYRAPRQGARLEGMADVELTPAPMHGEHTTELLSELGYAEDRIEQLRTGGAVR